MSKAASMRPRHKAAENARSAASRASSDVRASMRPRHKAAENGVEPKYRDMMQALLQ